MVPCIAAIGILSLEASAYDNSRRFAGCSPGRVCRSSMQLAPDATAVILRDSLELDPATNHPKGFYPNCGGPSLGPLQSLAWGAMDAVDTTGNVSISLNPAFASGTVLQSRQGPSGVPFFPADQTVTLYLVWRFPLGLELFNKDPIRLVNEGAVTGFPIAFGPDYSLVEPVELFDLADPEGDPVLTMDGSDIEGDIADPFVVDLADAGGGVFDVTVSLFRPGPALPAMVLAAGSPGVTGVDPETQEMTITHTPSTLQVTANLPASPCFDFLDVWVVSLDEDRLGVSSATFNLPHAPSCALPDPLANAGPGQTAQPQDIVTLDGTASSGTGTLGYCWAAPTGVTLDDPTSATPSFVAPATLIDRELVFTLFVDNGSTISPPDSTVVRLRRSALVSPGVPALGTLGRIAVTLLLCGAGVLAWRRGLSRWTKATPFRPRSQVTRKTGSPDY